LVGSAKRAEVARSVSLVDDRRRDTEPNTEKVQDEAPGPPVAIEEGVDLFKAGVPDGESLRYRGFVS
jgi:hypothetical protein